MLIKESQLFLLDGFICSWILRHSFITNSSTNLTPVYEVVFEVFKWKFGVVSYILFGWFSTKLKSYTSNI